MLTFAQALYLEERLQDLLRRHAKKPGIPVTWVDCVEYARDCFHELEIRAQFDPEHGTLYQQEMALMVLREQEARARAYETGELPPPLPKEERRILAERSFEEKIKSDICPMCEKPLEEREYIEDEVWMEPCGHHYTGDAHTVKWDPVQRTIAWDCYHPERGNSAQ